MAKSWGNALRKGTGNEMPQRGETIIARGKRSATPGKITVIKALQVV
jgi:hypothetical protein